MKSVNQVVVVGVFCALVGIGGMGCNTVRGAGKDIQKGGKAVEQSVSKVEEDRDHRRAHEHSIMASAEHGGSIIPSGNTNVSYGSRQAYSIRAMAGYRVSDVLIDGRSVGAVGGHTFTDVTAGHTITASFCADGRH